MSLPIPHPGRINVLHRRLGGNMGPGVACANGVDVVQRVTIAGSPGGSVRFKATAAGSLKFEFQSSDGVDTYGTGNPVAVPVVANTETKLDFTARGEAYAIITFTPSANGTFTFVDLCAL